jgi:hypothetical protein
MRYLLLALLIFSVYAALDDVWYFVRDPSEMRAPLHTRTPAMHQTDGSAFECISRVEQWRKSVPNMKPTCQVVPAYRHWRSAVCARSLVALHCCRLVNKLSVLVPGRRFV